MWIVVDGFVPARSKDDVARLGVAFKDSKHKHSSVLECEKTNLSTIWCAILLGIESIATGGIYSSEWRKRIDRCLRFVCFEFHLPSTPTTFCFPTRIPSRGYFRPRYVLRTALFTLSLLSSKAMI